MSTKVVSVLLISAFALYMIFVSWNIYCFYYPSPCTSSEECIHPSWSNATKFNAMAFVSTRKQLNNSPTTIWSKKNFDISAPTTIQLNVTLPQQTLKNGSLYFHFFLMDQFKGKPDFRLSALSHSTYKIAPVTKHVVKTKSFKLLELDGQSDIITESEKPVTHWIPQLSIHVMSEPLSLFATPQEMARFLMLNSQKEYLPMVFINHLGHSEKDFIPIESNSTTMPLTLTYVPVSYGKMRLIIFVELGKKVLDTAGIFEKDTDPFSAIFFHTNFYLLLLTFIVGSLNLLFDALAFKNDISFWRKRMSNVGVSIRSLVLRFVSESIVFAYLCDQGASRIVIAPAGISALIEAWKVTKALKLKVVRSGRLVRLKFDVATEAEKQSNAYDSEGMKYLWWLVMPYFLAGAAYSFFYLPDTGWYSICLKNIVNGVYLYGLLAMLLQLFVNYKLKSVDHLPWKAFMYKALNAVVDDIYAFVFNMPMSHRMTCFRDDFVLLIYLYQLWLYPADSNRTSADKAKRE